jgi:hypothetical protein
MDQQAPLQRQARQVRGLSGNALIQQAVQQSQLDSRDQIVQV